MILGIKELYMEIHSFMVLVPMIAGNSNKLIAVWNYVIIAI